MRLLYDAVLPQSLSGDTPGWAELDRWTGTDQSDVAIVQATANRGYRGVIFYGQDSLEQSAVREMARERGVALVAVEAKDPTDAKQRVLRNLTELQSALIAHDCVVIMAKSVRRL